MQEIIENAGSANVKNMLEYIDDGSYVIPYFQRGFEWDARMVCDLIESILQKYYTGIILLWELNQKEAKDEKWDPVWGAELKETPRNAILDGQQRLSSLYYAIYNPNKNFPNRKSYFLFFLNLTKILNDEFEESVSYKFYSSYQNWEQIRNKSNWSKTGLVPISILSAKESNSNKYIDSKEYEDLLINYLEINKKKLPASMNILNIDRVIRGILNYNFVFYPLSSNRNLQDICNIFARVNSKGMKLSTFDLMNAFLFPKGVKLRKELWEKLDNELLKNIDKNMNEYLLKIISLKKQNYCSSKYLYNLIPDVKTTRRNENGNIYNVTLVSDGNEFKVLWKEACEYAEKARTIIMNTGIHDFGAIKTGFIPNTTIVPVLASILWEYKGDINYNNLTKWYWSAVISEDYSGSSDTVMAKDFRDWKEWTNSGKIIERINRINKNFINELDLKSVKKGSSRYNAILSLLAINDAKDFFKGRIVGTGDYQNESINDHHIFPIKVNLSDSGRNTNFADFKDSILNRTLLLDETNKKINNNKPSQYINNMKGIHGNENKVIDILKSHLINEESYKHLKNNDFDNFIIEREKSIKQHIILKLDL